MNNPNSYFDTNVYSRLVDRFAPADYPAISSRLSERGIEVYLSPTNIIEFLQTLDPTRREQLISLAQHICAPSLLIEVESMIVHQVASTTADQRLVSLLNPGPFCRSDLARVWDNVRADKSRTFRLGSTDLERFRIVRETFTFLHAHLRRGGSGVDLWEHLKPLGVDPPQDVQDQIGAALKRRRAAGAPPAESLDIPIEACTHLMAATVLCAGLSPFNQDSDKLWEILALTTTPDRYRHTRERFPFVLERGPLTVMGKVMAKQALEKHDHGNLFDCYHACYAEVADAFYTFDEGLLELRSAFHDSRTFTKINSGTAVVALVSATR